METENEKPLVFTISFTAKFVDFATVEQLNEDFEGATLEEKAKKMIDWFLEEESIFELISCAEDMIEIGEIKIVEAE